MSILDFAKTEETQQGFIYTEEQLMARLKFFIGICLSLTLTGIVFVVLYSQIFLVKFPVVKQRCNLFNSSLVVVSFPVNTISSAGTGNFNPISFK